MDETIVQLLKHSSFHEPVLEVVEPFPLGVLNDAEEDVRVDGPLVSLVQDDPAVTRQ